MDTFDITDEEAAALLNADGKDINGIDLATNFEALDLEFNLEDNSHDLNLSLNLDQKLELDRHKELMDELKDQAGRTEDLNESQASRCKNNNDEIGRTEQDISRKKIIHQAPGLNLFTRAFLNRFTSDDLDLEMDFQHKNTRQRLLLLPGDSVKEVLSNPSLFLLYLAPESSSALIGDEEDFKAICDFLFFSCSSTLDDRTAEVYSKALVALLCNYDYPWRLKLKHICACLRNFGIDKKCVSVSSSLTGAMASRLKIVEKMYEAKGEKFQSDLLRSHSVYTKKRRKQPDVGVDLEAKFRVIKNFIHLVALVVSSYPNNCDFYPMSDDWTHVLVLLNLMFLIASDTNLVNDPFVFRDMRMFVNSVIDNFNDCQWYGISSTEQVKMLKTFNNNEVDNALCDVSEVIAEITAMDVIKTIKTWDANSLPLYSHFADIDHHHNIWRRLQFIPPSYRGNQIRKNIAYVCLQRMLDPDEIESFPNTGVKQMRDLLLKVKPMFYTLMSAKDCYIAYYIIRLTDVVIGNEDSDLCPENSSYLKELRELVDGCKKVSKHSSDDPNFIRVMEIMSHITCNWEAVFEKDSINE